MLLRTRVCKRESSNKRVCSIHSITTLLPSLDSVSEHRWGGIAFESILRAGRPWTRPTLFVVRGHLQLDIDFLSGVGILAFFFLLFSLSLFLSPFSPHIPRLIHTSPFPLLFGLDRGRRWIACLSLALPLPPSLSLFLTRIPLSHTHTYPCLSLIYSSHRSFNGHQRSPTVHRSHPIR